MRSLRLMSSRVLRRRASEVLDVSTGQSAGHIRNRRLTWFALEADSGYLRKIVDVIYSVQKSGI